jgi:hypothetical protein
VRRHDIPFNTLLALGNTALFFFVVQKKAVPSWIRAGFSGFFVIVGIGEIVLHHWVWGSFLALTGVLLVMVLREQKVHPL